MDACAVFSGWFHILRVQHGVESRIGETPVTLTGSERYRLLLTIIDAWTEDL
jgi:hypothetical protein